MRNEYIANAPEKFISKVEKINTKYEKCKEKEHYKKCLKLQLKILKMTNQNNQLNKLRGYTAKTVAHILSKLNKHKEAIKYLKIALNSFNKDDKDNITKELYEIYKDLYECSYKLGNHEDLIRYGIMCSEYKGIDEHKKCDIYSKLGRFHLITYMSESRYAYLIRGLFYCTEAISLFEKLGRTDELEYVYCLFDCSEVCYYLEDYVLALKNVEKVEKMAEKMKLPDELLFSVYNLLTRLYAIKGYTDTEMYYKSKSMELVNEGKVG